MPETFKNNCASGAFVMRGRVVSQHLLTGSHALYAAFVVRRSVCAAFVKCSIAWS